MQGYESFDREFLDTADLWHLVPEGSVYRFLAENRRRLFPDEMFADLFGSGRGPPVDTGSGDRCGDGPPGVGVPLGPGSDTAATP